MQASVCNNLITKPFELLFEMQHAALEIDARHGAVLGTLTRKLIQFCRAHRTLLATGDGTCQEDLFGSGHSFVRGCRMPLPGIRPRLYFADAKLA